jgi:hypothetical protein
LRARHRSRVQHRRCRLRHVPRPLIKFREKTPAGALTLLQGFGARPAGPLMRPHGKAFATGRKGVLSVGSRCGTPTDARGLLSGTTTRVP